MKDSSGSFSPLRHLELLSASQAQSLLAAGAIATQDGVKEEVMRILRRADASGERLPGYEAAQLVAAACMPWCAATHPLWPARARARVAELLEAVYRIAYRRDTPGGAHTYGGEATGLYEVLCAAVLPHELADRAEPAAAAASAAAMAATT
jgi:hypothetical protein